MTCAFVRAKARESGHAALCRRGLEKMTSRKAAWLSAVVLGLLALALFTLPEPDPPVQIAQTQQDNGPAFPEYDSNAHPTCDQFWECLKFGAVLRKSRKSWSTASMETRLTCLIDLQRMQLREAQHLSPDQKRLTREFYDTLNFCLRPQR